MIFTDRSRQKAFYSCQFERFLGYHLGGSGITGKGTSIPLATGSHTHEAIEMILKGSWNELPKESLVRHAIETVKQKYEEEVAEAGFLDPEVDEDRVLYVLNEQTTLIHGLIWAWASFILPEFLEEFEVLYVEQEMERIATCTCGLSAVGKVADHVSRGCKGLVIMTRPDIVTKKYKVKNSYAYHEVKTGGKIDSDTFEGDVQFAFGALGVEGHTGQELTESYVHALNKGYRVAREKDGKKGPKLQQSALCYAYVKEGIDGLVPIDVRFKYGGKGIQSYTKTPVWEIKFPKIKEGIPPVEHYISMMEDSDLASHVKKWGPFPYPKQQAEDMLADTIHLEQRNHETFTYIDERISEYGFADESVQADIHEFIPKSWNCRRWGHQICSYYSICNKLPGWETPCESMGYAKREPNHPVEFEFEEVLKDV